MLQYNINIPTYIRPATYGHAPFNGQMTETESNIPNVVLNKDWTMDNVQKTNNGIKLGLVADSSSPVARMATNANLHKSVFIVALGISRDPLGSHSTNRHHKTY
jgi:hypothetical protein